MAVKAASISAAVLALKKISSSPRSPLALLSASEVTLLAGTSGLIRTAKRLALGSSSCMSARRLASISLAKKLNPVALPPGRARLATKPSATGSSPTANIIGIVVVAALAATDAGLLAGVAIAETLRLIASLMIDGISSL